ncbi:MAG: DUF2232 domain-containing protein [Leptolyngbyaceae cyanobacterium T60_A2020_046]|nr:DUF2232 domain-containing protein [Leptolyngbyaceae cyanobacterium T60_A2020_046]
MHESPFHPAEEPTGRPSWSDADPAADRDRALADDLAEVETYLNYRDPQESLRSRPAMRSGVGPVAMVETAFLASAASLIWLVNAYFPPGPLLRIVFPLPIALVYLRWGQRSAWMGAFVSGLLLAVLMGPPRSLLFVMPYGLLGVQLGWMWRRGASWYASMGVGAILSTLGFFVRIALLSLMLGEDMWVYLMNQVTQLINWGLQNLVNWGVLGFGVLSQSNLTVIQIFAVVMIFASSVVYLLTVHLAAWLLLERLGEKMPPPPGWVQRLLEA